jgi:hypothetical protein
MKIKILLFTLIVGAATSTAFAQSVPLNQGQSYTFQFTSLPIADPPSGHGESEVIAWFDPGTFNFGESALLEIFANTLSDNPVSTTVAIVDVNGRTGLWYTWSGPGNPSPPFFPDLQGVLRVTMLNGNAQLSGFQVSQVIDGQFYSGYFPIPEPTTAAFAVAALACAFLKRPRTLPIFRR